MKVMTYFVGTTLRRQKLYIKPAEYLLWVAAEQKHSL